MQTHLPDRVAACQALLAEADRPRSLRGALEAAIALHTNLPLLAQLFFHGDISQALGCPDAAVVTAEVINGICDPNRGGALRVDFVAYSRAGAITRYHPGSTPAQSAKPHTVPPDSRSFRLDAALQHGIGVALHTHAPGIARTLVVATEHGGPLFLVSAKDLQDIHPLDSKLVSPHALQTALAALPRQPGEVDWAYCGFPWWTLMATRRPRFATIIQEGIEAVAGVRAGDGSESMRITTTRTQYVVTVSGGKLSVR